MEFKVITYLIYIVISLILTAWVGNTLHKHGRTFLLDIFRQDAVLTDSINKLLLIGFYLINFGYILHNLITKKSIDNGVEMIEHLSTEIGIIVIVLGVIHLVNITILLRMRSRVITPKQTFQSSLKS